MRVVSNILSTVRLEILRDTDSQLFYQPWKDETQSWPQWNLNAEHADSQNAAKHVSQLAALELLVIWK